MFRSFIILSLVALLLTACANQSGSIASTDSAEARAIAFLQREVPAWSRDNGCFSCHNNGDAARALFAAIRHGYRIPQNTIAGTTAWVSSSSQWSDNKGDPGFSDQRLADIQFTASLASALEAGSAGNHQALEIAAIKVAQTQVADGSWPIDSANAVGSPATYGQALATFMAWDSLRRVSVPRIAAARQKAEERLSSIKADSVPNAAVLLLFGAKSLAVSPVTHQTSLDFLRRAQTSDGGWGPYVDSPPEAFDTALALLALAEFQSQAGAPEMIRRGRKFLTQTQQSDGSWPATTRPSGGQSYAQQMSTTGWATLALLATR
ncbi:MAG TPA: hypothetical protein VFZ59_04025 [Verrucomicrobiae bacterium]|nr:hypothetical protein [Verrucomicrobiae bacterium]